MASPPAEARNRLAHESSAYLRQHMDNPVDWYPWGDEALARAREEQRPLLVSIGYSACHWCHVMAHESFEDPETAALMNRLFVNVKVDREERPDVDQIYMDTVVRLTGHGGWPLTVFCTPDGKPFHAGTYYPPAPRHGLPSFRQLLEAVDRAWRERRGEVEQSAAQILEALRARPGGMARGLPGRDALAACATRLLEAADREHGGFGGAPKFPTPTNLDLLLAAADVLPDDAARDAVAHVAFSCREMSRGGLYDHLGGGFHRYTVDGIWLVPHFEKMLYDQGQLLATFAEAWRRSGAAGDDDDLVWPIRETAEYLRRDLRAPDGGLYASEDADSEGEEGRFYVWTPAQVAEVLGAERAAAFGAAYDVTERGNFEGKSVLRDLARGPRGDFADERRALSEARRQRVAPGLDRKRITAWNALAASGLARAGSALDDPDLVDDARAVVDFLLARAAAPDGAPLRIAPEEGARAIPAFLDDRAALLVALLDLHRAGAGEAYLGEALAVADDLVGRFFDAGEGDFFLTPDDGERLVHRPRADHDGATPHSPGLAVLGLLRVATLTGRSDLRQVTDTVVRNHAFAVERVPTAFPTLLRAAAAAERGLSVCVVVGPPDDPATAALARRARRVLAPEDGVVVSAPDARPPAVDPTWLEGRGLHEGKPAGYVCRGVTCSLPATDPDELGPLPTPEDA